MGVSGSGKSTIGKLLAERLDCDFADADDFHPIANIEKMKSGQPLTDTDRWPWLDLVAEWLTATGRDHRTAVVACSALRRSYRDRLRRAGHNVFFVHLDGSRQLMRERMNQRDHFMPASLLDSQLSTLEPLQADELGLRLSANQHKSELADKIVNTLS